MESARGDASGGNGRHPPLSIHEAYAVARYLALVRRHVPAELVYALLFGSRARGTARRDSDIDLLLIFRSLPEDREPQATIAEKIAEEVAAEEGVPVEPWSVALLDLKRGLRTPMLVDALEDGVPIWPAHRSPPRPPFTPWDALRCTGALLQRVDEGSEEVAGKLDDADFGGAYRRTRDDIVRLCTAVLLLHGETRPRRARAVERLFERDAASGRLAGAMGPLHRWVIESFGPDGRDEDRAVPPPPGGLPVAAELIDRLRSRVARGRHDLACRLDGAGNPARQGAYERQGVYESAGAGVSYWK
jgi:hypothetical protein